ncbi:putative leader peptide [Streptomyces sp. Ru71]
MRTRAALPAHSGASRSPLLTSRRHIDLLRVCSAISSAAG